MQVKKRDGQIEDFEITKVEKAILKAARKVKEQLTDDILDKLKSYVLKKVSKLEEPIEILDIQKATEEALMKYNLFEVATEFHDYRQERDRVRFEKFTIIQEMEEKLSASNVQNQNANVDEHSFGGRKGEASSSMLKKLALDYMISPKFAKNHKNFVGYIHDLDSYRVGEHNCLSVPIDDLCDRPVTVKNPKDIRASQGIASFGEQVLVHIQSQSLMQFGGVSVTHLDWSSVPYMRASFWKRYQSAIEAYKAFTGEVIENPVAKEDRKEVSITDKRYKANKKIWDIAYKELVKESDQAAEALIHNLGTLMSRSGNQLPFSSINYGTCTLEEGRVFSKSLLKTWDRGIGELGLTPIFPCGIFQYKKGVNDKPGTPNYDLKKEAIRVLVKRDYPNFANCDWSVQHKAFEQSQAIKKKVLTNLDKETFEKVGKLPIKIQERLGFTVDSKSGLVEMNKTEQPYEMMSTMGCRTYNGFDINFTEEYFEKVLKRTVEAGSIPNNMILSGIQKDGRGNIAPCTIVLPFVAMEAKKKAKENPEYVVDYFMDLLEKYIGDAKDELIERFNWIAAQPASSAKYMYNNNTMKGYEPEEGIRSALIHGTLAIGQLGLAECLTILIGEDQTTEKGMELAKKIESLYNEKCNEYKHNYRLNFGVYFTPSENLCFTSFKAFKKKYGVVPGVTNYTDKDGNVQEKLFFTNSIHIPVWKGPDEGIDWKKKIDLESQLTGYSNAGCITYLEISDSAKNNLEGIEQILDYEMEKDIPYAAFNFNINECTECGSTDVDDEACKCRVCGSTKINWLARITGYINGNYLETFNLGKQDEKKKRVKHC